ncbi:hypothetical protein CAPTEDRAFT_3426 [Capitella teleta]|uniref:carbonyl reductase (NADPH) n=1 Tax=Capitella teleta TaxID=283909 RepID=R7UH66_CAPTE|nr:hypothetical protein CAPTEDRAFT_3426 [Capitella teleta]|eukprot:ELU03148.1 hypothetical protein CAPTEDRAFT_3426 [Capitella teleta]
MRKVAVVTGSNKGIGYAIVRGLCKQFAGDVILTARNEERGIDAVSSLEKEGLYPKFHQLDIEDQKSIDQLKDFLDQNYGGLDILVNNAGISFRDDITVPFKDQARVTLNINYTGTVAVLKTMMPILNSGARVVNMSSALGSVVFRESSAAMQKKICDCTCLDDVTDLMSNFVQAAKNNTHDKEGWPSSAYGVSKIGISALSSILQKTFDADNGHSDVVINACCPGFVVTDLTKQTGIKTIDEGADTPLYLALLPANVAEPKGQFVADRRVEDWKTYVYAHLDS